MFDSSMVNESSGFEPLKFYCRLFHDIADFAAMLLVNESFIILIICRSHYVTFGPCF